MPHTDSEGISQNRGNRMDFSFPEAEEKVSFRGLTLFLFRCQPGKLFLQHGWQLFLG